MLPPRRRPEPKKRKVAAKPPTTVRSQGHLRWVRGFHCCVPGCGSSEVEAAHIRIGTNGGAGKKPGDNWVIALCRRHHAEQHGGERSFATRHNIDPKALAAEFWRNSPHRRAWENKHGKVEAGPGLPD